MNRLWINGWQCKASALLPLKQAANAEDEADLSYEQTAMSRQQWLTQQTVHLHQDTTLVGWSLGGMLACELAAMSHLVKRVQIICANTQFSGGAGLPSAVAENFLMRYGKNPSVTRKKFSALVDSKNPEQVADMLLEGDHLGTLSWLYECRIAELNLNCELQVLLAQDDRLVPIASATQAWQALNAEVTCVNAEHSLPMRAPELVAKWMAQHG